MLIVLCAFGILLSAQCFSCFARIQPNKLAQQKPVSGIGMPCVFHFQRIRCGKNFADLKKKFVVGDKYVLLYELLLYEILKLEDT